MEEEQFFDSPPPVSKDIEITDEQWVKVKEMWNSRPNNPPSIEELTEVAFGQKFKGTSKEGRAVKKRLAKEHSKKVAEINAIELNAIQKEYVKNNYSKMKGLEMAKVLFTDPKLLNNSKETRAIHGYIQTLDPSKSYENADIFAGEEYVAPRTVAALLKRVNYFTNNKLEEDKLNGKQKKDMQSLSSYLNTYRFIKQINTYNKNEDRKLFESTFIRYTYTKFDLAEEEVDEYIMLATEIVNASDNRARVEALNRILDGVTEDPEGKISMSLVEAINVLQKEFNDCSGRQSKLLVSLKVKRSEKEGKDKTGTASIINLVQMMQDEVSRNKMIELAQKRKEILKEGVEKLMSMEDLKCKIMGIDMQDILEG